MLQQPLANKTVELPAAVTIYPTNHCFKSCTHCVFVMDGTLNSKHLDIQLLKNVIRDLAKSKVLLIGVAGGDPILYPHFDELIQEIVANRMFPILTLSGAGLSAAKIKNLYALGIRSVQLSLDGSNADTHDKIRGSGSFTETIEAIQSLRQKNIAVSLATCIHQENRTEFNSLLRLAHKLGADKIKVQRWRPVQTSKGLSIKELSWNEFSDLQNQTISLDLEVVFERQSNGRLNPNQSLAILASGDLVRSEFDEPFGNIHSHLPSYYFKESLHVTN